MITDRMSLDEVKEQLFFDIHTFEKSNDYRECLNKYRRYLIRNMNKTSVKFRTKSFTSDKFQNTYYMITNAYINKKTKSYSLDITYYTFRYLERGGMIAYQLCLGDTLISDVEEYMFVFPQHFWERYRERYLEEDIHGFDLIHKFFENNCIERIRNNEERGENEVIGIVNDGLCLGIKENAEINVFKTFISNKEMHDNQILSFEKGLNSIEKEKEFLTTSKFTAGTAKILFSELRKFY